MFKSIWQIVSILDARSRAHFLWLLLPMAVMTLLEVASISLILPVVQVLLLGQTDGMLTKVMLFFVPQSAQDTPGVWIAGIFAAFFVFKNLLLLCLIFITNKVVTSKAALYTRRVFEIYLAKPMTFHFKNNSAELLRNITGATAQSLEAVRIALLMCLDAMLMFGAFAMLVFVEPEAMIGAIVVLGTIGGSFYLITSPIFHHWGEQSMILEGTLIRWISQSFNGIRDIKLFHAHDYVSNKVGATADAYADFSCRSITVIHVPRLLIETVVVIGFLGIVLLLLSMSESPADVVATLGLFGMAALRLMPSLNRLLTAATEIRRRAAYIGAVHEAFTPETNDSVSFPSDSGEELSFENKLELRDVAYAYPGTKSSALNEFSLTIQKSSSIGFVGQSGAGKSTLMDIILGLLKPTAGRMLADGKDVFENISGWQRKIGFVPQQVFIMDDSIRRNIAFGIEDERIDDRRIDEVLQLTSLDELVADMPNGLSTVLGEHGTRISGGQRQRIAIARALYRDPDVIVFDEATSALDNITEKEISAAIDSLSGNKTIITVAHRLSTVQNCDLIVLMKDGAIVATGTYDELISESESFRKLALLDDQVEKIEGETQK